MEIQQVGGDTPTEKPLITDSSLTSNDRTTSESTTVIAKDKKGNQVVVPGGFKISSASGESVQQGIVIEDKDGNQFVWVPVGTIKNKNNTTNTITLGRYEFDSNTGALKSNTPVQVASVENCTQEVTINTNYKELSVFRAGNSATDSTAQNATARNLEEFISTTLANGGYYIARFEASGTASKITSKYNQTVLGNITQPNAAKAAREMYGEIKENNKLVYASDLVNSYAWDTAIIFIQTYSGESNYTNKNKSITYANTGINNDKYCNIWDMSGNVDEWTTESSPESDGSYLISCVYRMAASRGECSVGTKGDHGIRTIIYVD